MDQLGFENLPGWTVNDRVYAWDGNQWVMYFYAFDNKWHKIGSFFPAGEDVVAGHTAVFVYRTSGGTAPSSGNKHVLPTDYDWR
ncbi:MAG: hypothetical protein GWO24_22210 [Akkermansiaceae bacterium]|nr:hypothetical protein [Akkermansiaceae bacterium]